VRDTEAAGRKLASPDWLAVNTVDPSEWMVTILPETEATEEFELL
jgi:hypothetical protein